MYAYIILYIYIYIHICLCIYVFNYLCIVDTKQPTLNSSSCQTMERYNFSITNLDFGPSDAIQRTRVLVANPRFSVIGVASSLEVQSWFPSNPSRDPQSTLKHLRFNTCCFPPTASSILILWTATQRQPSPATMFQVQGAPFPVAMTFTLRVRTDSPPPQENWQTLQSTQGHPRAEGFSILIRVFSHAAVWKITLSYRTICVYMSIYLCHMYIHTYTKM